MGQGWQTRGRRIMAKGIIILRGIQAADIPNILDYWFNPANRDYHLKRGSDPAMFLSSGRETAAYTRKAETPLAAPPPPPLSCCWTAGPSDMCCSVISTILKNAVCTSISGVTR